MSRIFISLSLLPLFLVVTTMGVGWWIGDYNGIYANVIANAKTQTDSEQQLQSDLAKLEEPQQRFKMHFQLGLATSLAVVLINSLSVTYLIGTSRWVKEVCDAYELDDRFVRESTIVKRRTFPWSICGVLAILVVIALGAAADPGNLSGTTSKWVTPHLIAAILGACVIVFAIVNQAINLHRNSEIINEVVEEVQRERTARGLPVESEDGSEENPYASNRSESD